MGEEKRSASSQDASDVGTAVLTEAVRHGDIIHTSLAGMTAITLILAGALSLPLFGTEPVTHMVPLLIVDLTVFVGIIVLYLMNYRVHHHVATQAALTEVLVNSLGQGFLTFDRNGLCGSVYSQACVDLLEAAPNSKNLSEVLRIPESGLSDFHDWLDILFVPNHALSFEDVVSFFPQFYMHSQGRRVHLAYRPIRGKTGELKQVVLIATDETDEYQAREQARKQQAFADMITRIFRDRNQFYETLSRLKRFLAEAAAPSVTFEQAPDFFRQLHTLKAAVRHFSLLEMGDLIQRIETELHAPEVANDREFVKKLQVCRQTLAGEMDRLLADLRGLLSGDVEGVVREVDERKLYAFARELEQVAVAPDLVRGYLQQIVAVPLFETFTTFERDLIELVHAMNKQAHGIVYKGVNPRILVRPWQDFLFSLMHICRNIADHGIEAPSVRLSRRKDPAATITIAAILEDRGADGAFLLLNIEDDGAGIDPQRIREKLSAVDPEGDWMQENDHQVIQHIFRGGFSTRENVTELSGRGVGMDAVEFELKKLGGSIEVHSTLGAGTRFAIKIPYHLDLSVVGRAAAGETWQELCQEI